MPCFSEITSSFALWGRAALRLPSRDGDGAPAPTPGPLGPGRKISGH